MASRLQLKRKSSRPRVTLEDMQYHAKKRGGKCLSKTYIKSTLKLTWQCKKGHIWDAIGQSIRNQQSWCPKCAGRVHDIPYMQNLARKRGGLCLPKKFTSVTKKLQWQCSKGHRWRARPASIKRGAWCAICTRHNPSFSIEDMQNFAKKYKGFFVSVKYKGYRDKHKWQCKIGHIFNDTHENIKRRGYFCVKCKRLS